jgi:DNA-binding CsgD family transcriptional regulator
VLAYGEGPSSLALTAVALIELAARERYIEQARATATDTLDVLLPGCVLEAAEVAAAALAVGPRDERIVERLPAADGDGRLAAFLAQCEAELGRRDWAEVAERWMAIGERYQVAYASYRAAEAVPARAPKWLRAAFALATDLGAAPLLAQIEGFARRARVRLSEAPPPPAPVADALGLTAREREVLRLLAEGRSNGEIGRALYITTKTASTHVSNIIRKLDACNRVEAAGLAVRLGLA